MSRKEIWHNLAMEACSTNNTILKKELLYKSIAYHPTRSWPYVHLAEIIDNLTEKLNLYIKSIQIDNSQYAYVKIYQIMKDLGFIEELETELNKIELQTIIDPDIYKAIEIFKDYIRTGKKEEKRKINSDLDQLVAEFLSISDFNKIYGISLKCAFISDESKILDYEIVAGKIIINTNELSTLPQNTEYLFIENQIEQCYIIDFIVDSKNNLKIGYKHNFISDRNTFVIAVGAIVIDNKGIIRKINNKSGHYRPTIKESMSFPNILKQHKLDLTFATLDFQDYVVRSQRESFWEQKHKSMNYKPQYICEELLAFIRNIKPKSWVLDHGCGAGRVAQQLSEQDCLIGINDISETAVAKSRNIKNILHAHVGPIQNWDGPLNFDAIISHRVLHTLTKEQLKVVFNFFNKNCHSIFISARSVECKEREMLESNSSNKIEENTYYKPNQKLIHFFTQEELIQNLDSFMIISSGTFKESSGWQNQKENTYCYAIATKNKPTKI